MAKNLKQHEDINLHIRKSTAKSIVYLVMFVAGTIFCYMVTMATKMDNEALNQLTSATQFLRIFGYVLLIIIIVCVPAGLMMNHLIMGED